jgi:hypothetical protein
MKVTEVENENLFGTVVELQVVRARPELPRADNLRALPCKAQDKK